MKTFWDFCARFYDFAQLKSPAYRKTVALVAGMIDDGARVIELAAGTGEFSLACAVKAKTVLCSDISENMLKIARKKAKKRGISNVRFENHNIYEISAKDNSFDFVLAPQVLHLLDDPQKAARELRRVCAGKIIIPQCLLKDMRLFARLKVGIWKILGFAPKIELDFDSYKNFLESMGFDDCKIIYFECDMPMAIAVWDK